MARLLKRCAGLVFVSALALPVAAREPTRPQFRSGVTVTRLEVTVLDKRTRTPVKGLTADDFVIKVNGERQPIVSVAEVVVSAADPPTPSILPRGSG